MQTIIYPAHEENTTYLPQTITYIPHITAYLPQCIAYLPLF